jgi:probable F420-dependent oxidoreductase
MKFWLPVVFEPVEQTMEIAKIAESVGYHGASAVDHVVIPTELREVHPSGEANRMAPEYVFPDPFVLLTAMAAATERLRFATTCYVASLRDPFSVAKTAGTLAAISDYRFALGVGVGWLTDEIRIMGRDPVRRGARVDEMLTIVRDYWDDGYCTFSGEFYDVPRSAMFPVPSERIPMWIGGMSDAALRRAARHDGWIGDGCDPAELPELLRRLTELRADAGNERADYEIFVAPMAPPSDELYESLTALGVTSTVALPYDIGTTTVEQKRAALESFARTYIDRFGS